MWCMPNIAVVILGLIVIAILVGLGRWALTKFPVDAFILNIVYVLIVVCIVLWLLNSFCLFDNLSSGHPRRG
jgi:hypothetical protein